MIIDLHVRTDGTGGGLSLSEVARTAKERGIDGLAVTPLGRIAHAESVREASAKSGIPIFVGIELETDRGRILAFPPSAGEEYTSAPWGTPVEDGWYDYEALAEALCDRGYALVAAQPYDEEVDAGIGENLFQLAGLHAIIAAAGTKSHFAHDRALEAALSMHVAAVAGTATSDDLSRLGRVGTVFAEEVHEQRELVRSLRRGDAWIAAFGGGAEPGRERRDDRGGPRGGHRGDGGRGRPRGGRSRERRSS